MVTQCDELVYTPVNALTFKITGNTLCLKPVYNDKKHIIALKGPEDILIDLGLTVLVRKLKYKVNIIERIPNEILSISNKVEYHISMAKRTKASTFLMPMLPGTKKLYFWNKLFINCFIGTDEDNRCIALLFRWSSDLRFIKFEKLLSTFKMFRRRYDPNPHLVMFIFDIPKGYAKDYRAFTTGKYSKMSREYKIDILDFHDADIQDEIGQIIFKSSKRKDLLEEKLGAVLPEGSELLSILDIKTETYNPKIYELKKLL
jgi:hypothetical protein|tara:strand:- start:3824 stop:4600 length:777 start_codon:yes stop_codon:yes gene_type:complete